MTKSNAIKTYLKLLKAIGLMFGKTDSKKNKQPISINELTYQNKEEIDFIFF